MAALMHLANYGHKTVNDQVYELFVRYTKYAAASYARTCPSPPNGATIVAYLSDTGTDTQATVFKNDINQELIVAFRGTSSILDFGTDFNSELVPFEAAGIACTECRVGIPIGYIHKILD